MARHYTIHNLPDHLLTEEWRQGVKLLAKVLYDSWLKEQKAKKKRTRKSPPAE